MKLKLKVIKVLKRNLKELALKESLERNEFIKKILLDDLNENKKLWEEKIIDYEQFIIERDEKLKLLKTSLLENDELSEQYKQKLLNDFYKEHLMFKPIINKKRKLENIIINLDENEFYALQILAEIKETTIDSYVIDLLYRI